MYRNDGNDFVVAVVSRLLLARIHGGSLLVLLLLVLGLEEEGVYDLTFTIIGLLSVLSLLPTIQGVTNPYYLSLLVWYPTI